MLWADTKETNANVKGFGGKFFFNEGLLGMRFESFRVRTYSFLNNALACARPVGGSCSKKDLNNGGATWLSFTKNSKKGS